MEGVGWEKMKVSLAIGIVLLVLFFVSMVGFALESRHQIDCTMYLNQYRLGSKALTTAVRSYAVTGSRQYYDAYKQELEVDKNRDTAWAGLEANNLTAKEWEVLRIGADFRLRCLGCGRQIMIARKLVEKNIREIRKKA